MGDFIILQISGTKNTGKTSIVQMLVSFLSKQGYRVGCLKHDGHDFEADVPGTDSHRFQKAGSIETIIFSNSQYMIVKKKQESLESMISKFSDIDILLIEGCKNSTYPKIEILRKGFNEIPACNDVNKIAYITDFEYESDIPVLSYSNIDLIQEFVLKYAQTKLSF